MDREKEIEFEITLVRDDDDDPYVTVWVGPVGTSSGLVCGKFPGTLMDHESIRNKIDRLAAEMYLAHLGVMRANEENPPPAHVDDGKWLKAKPS